MKQRTAWLLATLALCVASGSDAQSTQPWSVRFADAVMQRKPAVHERWDYTAGLVLLAIDRAGDRSRDLRYARYVKENIDRFVGADGAIRGYRAEDYNLDQINEGRLLLSLFAWTKDIRYRKAADALRDQLRRQ